MPAAAAAAQQPPKSTASSWQHSCLNLRHSRVKFERKMWQSYISTSEPLTSKLVWFLSLRCYRSCFTVLCGDKIKLKAEFGLLHGFHQKAIQRNIIQYTSLFLLNCIDISLRLCTCQNRDLLPKDFLKQINFIQHFLPCELDLDPPPN